MSDTDIDQGISLEGSHLSLVGLDLISLPPHIGEKYPPAFSSNYHRSERDTHKIWRQSKTTRFELQLYRVCEKIWCFILLM